MKLGRRLILIVLLVMGFLILFGKKGLVDNYKVRQKVAELSSTNQQMRQENNRLKQEILLLRKNTKYIERLARDELGMVKKGDIIYRISEESRPRAQRVKKLYGRLQKRAIPASREVRSPRRDDDLLSLVPAPCLTQPLRRPGSADRISQKYPKHGTLLAYFFAVGRGLCRVVRRCRERRRQNPPTAVKSE